MRWMKLEPIIQSEVSQKEKHQYSMPQLSHFSHVRLSVTPSTVACQAPLSMGFFRQEYGSGFPFPYPGDLPNPGTELVSLVSPPLAGGFFFFNTNATWEALSSHI